MEEETTKERQINELAAMKAIFTDQFINCNENFSQWKPLDIILTVFPLRENSGPPEFHVQVNLHIIASEDYPNKIPKIILEKPKGLSHKQLSDIKSKLIKLAESKIGEVMIYELVQYIQNVLTKFNKPSFGSFYDEMVSRQREQKQKEAEIQKAEENIQRQLIKLEVTGIKKERQRRRKNKKSGKLNDVLEISDSASNMISNGNVNHMEILHKQEMKKTDTENNQTLINLPTNKSECGNGDDLPYDTADSRLVKEFEILDFVGRGAFGDVLKVRNKLDEGLYAIKRIQLNLKNKLMNKKIMREVKVLSRLNHENVVRYFNSWIGTLEPTWEECARKLSTVSNKKKMEEDRTNFSIENLNLSFPYPNNICFNDVYEDEDDDDDDNDWIEFLNDEAEINEIDSDNYSVTPEFQSMTKTKIANQCMYIQMEFCEKSTLRNAIDNNLYEDENRVWQLLKEVVEGLSYIHQQGIIHRDLKPVNIFIDSKDRVKIGDFGLATPNKCLKLGKTSGISTSRNDVRISEDAAETSLSGQVGTALYAAPELNSSSGNAHYNQKVDVYSLGIIFFEMCHRPFKTEMERYKVLSNLRTVSRKFPDDFFNNSKLCRQIKLIRVLLNHNPLKRPSANEILEQSYIPLSELKDEKLHETVRDALGNPQSKMYKHLIGECFSQKVSVPQDITFDDFSLSHTKIAWQHGFIEQISEIARRIFRLHGGTYFSTPLLSPNNAIGRMDTSAVTLMTRSGCLINIPSDLRLSFARYLAQNPHITHMKRYTIDKVFRERRLLGIHPKEMFECTFDIVSSSSISLTMETEVLSIVCELLDSFPEFVQKNCVLRLNHVSLVTSILFHYHIVAKKHIAVCSLLNKIKFQTNNPLSKVNVVNEIRDLGVSESTVSNLIQTMNIEIMPNNLSSHFSSITRKSGASASFCKQALTQIKTLLQYLSALNPKCSVVIAPNVISNFHYYSGLMFQMAWEHKNKNKLEKDVIAVGGRYDSLIKQYRQTLNIVKENEQSAVGISIFLDKLTNILSLNNQLFPTVDVLVHSVGKNDMTYEKLKIVKDLWSAEIRSTILSIEQSLEETQNYCAKMRVPHIVFIKESEPGVAGLRSWTKDRFYERKLSISEIVPSLRKMLKEPMSNIDSSHANSNNQQQYYNRSESRSASVTKNEAKMINFTFLIDEKLSYNNKRKYENQIFSTISNSLQKLCPKMKVEIIVLNIEYELIKSLATDLDINVKDSNSLANLIKKYPRHKKCLNRVADFFEELQSCDNLPIIIFYSLPENQFKVLI